MQTKPHSLRQLRCAPVLVAVVMSMAVLAMAPPWARAEANRVSFPSNLDRLVHYTTVKRGDVTEHLLTSQEALDAARLGKTLPDGTQVVLVDYRDNKVFRYFVMEKKQGWGADFPAARRTGDWQFQHFKADQTVNLSENSARCQSCHQGRAGEQHLFTLNDMKRLK